MPYFAGLRGTGQFGTDERPKSFREMILWLQPNGLAPLFALTSKAKDEPVDDPEFAWWEETLNICRVQVTPALTNVATAAVVVSGALELIVGDLLQVEKTQVTAYDNEIVRVTAIASDTAFTIARGQAGSTAAAIADLSFLTRVGNAQSEGNVSVASSSNNPTKFKNYCQIFKTPFTVTNTAKATKFRTGDPMVNERKRKSFQHAEKIEQALFWGKAFETTDATNGNMPLRYTGGLREFITSNRTIFSADPTIDQIVNAFAAVFDYESGSAGNERIAFMGNEAMNWINKLVRDNGSTRINFDGYAEFYGMRLQRWILPQGTVYVKSHPLLNVHPTYKSSVFLLNPSGITYRPLRGRDTKVEKNIQANDADFEKDQWLTEAGFEFHFERTHAYLGGVKDW